MVQLDNLPHLCFTHLKLVNNDSISKTRKIGTLHMFHYFAFINIVSNSTEKCD